MTDETRLDTVDPLNADSGLTADEIALRNSVRALVDDHIRPHVAQWYEHGGFDRAIIPVLARAGLLGLHLSGYGCAGAGAVGYGLACLEVESADSGVRSFLSGQGALTMTAIHAFGSESQKQAWLPGLAGGEFVGCFALTEPGAGSDPASLTTRARRDGSDWVLDGAKAWITNGAMADVAVIWARTDAGIHGFLVPTTAPGFQAREIAGKQSMRVSVTANLTLDGCRIPAECALPDARGLRAALTCLNEARYGIAWGALGAARDCYQTALAYAAERAQFGRPIAGFQLTQEKLANMALELSKGTLLALHLGRLKESGRLTPAQISMGKLNNVREALAIAREARTILGAQGIMPTFSPLRHANNLESVLTYEGTSEVHTLVIGEALTGLPAYR